MIKKKSRRVWTCPPHFIQVEIYDGPSELRRALGPDDNDLYILRNWLFENIDNRFFIGIASKIMGSIIIESHIVAFESESDATYFALAKPGLLNY